MKEILQSIENNKDKHLEELIEFLRIPSISSDSSYDKDTEKCARWLSDHFTNIGLDSKIFETEGHPVVYAENKDAGEKAKTIMIYGHYDVQPVDPIDLWDNDPFDPKVIDGMLYGRGTADDKGQLFTHVKSVEEIIKKEGKLPVNIKFIIEGEEEAGSSHLDGFIKKHKDMLACDVVLISDTEWFAEGMPTICYGLRGISFIEIELVGPNRDLHSGSFGGAVDNPANVLAWLISQLKDNYGRITIPGFYDDVLELTEEERANFNKLPFNLKNYQADLGVSQVYGENGYSTLERVWARPSLDVNGMISGYTGPGAKTVLPSKASAKISMRLVPNQKADDITSKISKYLKEIAPATVKIDVKELHGGNPVLVKTDSPAIQSAINAFEKAFGKDVVYMREGGSIPIVETFDLELKAPVVLLGLGLPTDNIHSPNENFSLDNFFGGIKTSAIFINEFA